MLILLCMAVSAAAVHLSGGKLSALAKLEPERLWALYTAFAVQFLILGPFSAGPSVILRASHLASYGLLALFVIANRSIPGLMVLSFGGALNLVAIAANGGVMPASPRAYAAAGIPISTSGFANSAPLQEPRLAFLGDVFALAKPFPFSNVFSIGDIIIALGAALVIYKVCAHAVQVRPVDDLFQIRRMYNVRRLERLTLFREPHRVSGTPWRNGMEPRWEAHGEKRPSPH